MFFVLCAIDERHVALVQFLFQVPDWLTIVFKFSEITFLERSHLSGSWPNHFRSAVLGAMSLSHRSTLAFSFVKPRGQSLSTRMRRPSCLSGCSYTLLILIFMA